MQVNTSCLLACLVVMYYYCCACCTGKSVSDVKTEANNSDIMEHLCDDKPKPHLSTPYKCSMCNRSFIESGSLQKHKHRVHSTSRPYACSHCEKCFSCKRYLRIHMYIHTGKYKCTECGRCFSSNNQLKVHMRNHVGYKPFKCTVCSRQFTSASYLTIHNRIHTGEKPYKCHMCDRAFTQSGDLCNHMRIHTGEKPYKCSVCNRSFTQSGALQKHTRAVHSTSRPYEYHCFYCQKLLKVDHELNPVEKIHLCKRCFDLQVAFGITTADTAAEVTH